MPRIWAGLLVVAWGAATPAENRYAAADDAPTSATKTVSPSADRPPEPAGDLFDERPLPLISRRPRTESDADVVHATALLAHARMLMQRGDLGNALRRYQRAWRYHPTAVPIMERIVPLAFQSSVNRQAEGYRYAVIAADQGLSDPQLLTQLAVHLTRNNQPRRALQLYERLRKIQGTKSPSLRWVVQHVEMGRLCLILKQPTRSIEYFDLVRKAIKNPKQYSISASQLKRLLGAKHATCLLLANGYLQSRQYDAALEMFAKADEGQPNPALLAFRRARVAAVRKNIPEALAQLQQYLESGQTVAGTSPYELLRRLLLVQTGDQQQALTSLAAQLAELHKTQADNRPLSSYLAEFWRSQGRLQEAEALFQMLREQKPAANLNRGLVRIYLQQAAIASLYRILIETVAEDPQLESLNAQLAQIVKQDEGRVLDRILIHATENTPQDAKIATRAAHVMAILTAIAQRFEEADKWFATTRRVAPAPNVQLCSNWGRRMYRANRFPQAAEAFRAALQAQATPANQPLLYLLLADALVSDQQVEAALQAVRKSIQIKPDQFVAQSQIPWVLYRGKRYADAKRQYLAFLDKFDSRFDNDQIRRICRQARFILSTLALREGDFPSAERWLEEVLDEFPEDIGACNDLGYLWADQNKHLARSLVMVKRAVTAEPENAAYRDSLGWVYYRLGRFPQAVVELEKAVAQTADGVILDHLGDTYLKLQQLEKAQATWERALAVFKAENNLQQIESVQAKLSQFRTTDT